MDNPFKRKRKWNRHRWKRDRRDRINDMQLSFIFFALYTFFFVRCMCSIIIDVLPSRSFFSNIFRAHGFSAANRERADHFTTWTPIKYKSIFPLSSNVVYWTIVVVDFSTNIQATAEISTNTTHPPSIIWYITICANNQRPKKSVQCQFFFTSFAWYSAVSVCEQLKSTQLSLLRINIFSFKTKNSGFCSYKYVKIWIQIRSLHMLPQS